MFTSYGVLHGHQEKQKHLKDFLLLLKAAPQQLESTSQYQSEHLCQSHLCCCGWSCSSDIIMGVNRTQFKKASSECKHPEWSECACSDMHLTPTSISQQCHIRSYCQNFECLQMRLMVQTCANYGWGKNSTSPKHSLVWEHIETNHILISNMGPLVMLTSQVESIFRRGFRGAWLVYLHWELSWEGAIGGTTTVMENRRWEVGKEWILASRRVPLKFESPRSITGVLKNSWKNRLQVTLSWKCGHTGTLSQNHLYSTPRITLLVCASGNKMCGDLFWNQLLQSGSFYSRVAKWGEGGQMQTCSNLVGEVVSEFSCLQAWLYVSIMFKEAWKVRAGGAVRSKTTEKARVVPRCWWSSRYWT